MSTLAPHQGLGGGDPSFWSRHLVSLVVRLLPAGAVRDRYRQEFIAELYGLPRGRAYAQALGVAAHVWALRAAVGDLPRLEKGAVMATTTTPTLLCRVNLHHAWHTYSTEDGQRFERCSRCGKDQTERRNGGGATGFGAFA